MAGPIYFAIGDIHGEAAKLDQLHAAILERIASENRAAVIVHLGDYVDRGPDSRGVIDRVMAFEKRFDRDPLVRVVSLMGNHEDMMLGQLEPQALASDSWLASGGEQTIASYSPEAGADLAVWRNAVPEAHHAWLASRPTILYDQTRKLVFVHAGISPERFPNCPVNIHLWTRSDKFFNDANWPDREELKGLSVIHGHTPKSFEPEIAPRRINVDTGACFGGPLTAVMLIEGEAPEFLHAY